MPPSRQSASDATPRATPAPVFADAETAVYWRYIVSSLDRLVAVGAALPPAGLHWRLPAPATNSVAGLVQHKLGNAAENLLGVVCRHPLTRDRTAEFVADAVTGEALAALPAGALGQPRAHPRRGTLLAREVLLVVARHAPEHLGQAELTRDLWRATVDATKSGAPALPIS